MSIILRVAIIVIVAFGVSYATLYVLHRFSDTSNRKDLLDKTEPSKGDLDSPHGYQAGKLDLAYSQVRSLNKYICELQNREIAHMVYCLSTKAEKLLDAMKSNKHNANASQLFCCYLPTTIEVLNKYLDLEQSGEDITEQSKEVSDYLTNMIAAFDKQYTSIISNDKLDLSIEMQAMETILKRDGLIQNS